MLKVTAPVEAEAIIWCAVPVMLDTVPAVVANVPLVGKVTLVILV